MANINNIKPFDELRAELINSLLPVIGKYYGEKLTIYEGFDLASEAAFKLDKICRKFIHEIEEDEKNSVKSQTAKTK